MKYLFNNIKVFSSLSYKSSELIEQKASKEN